MQKNLRDLKSFQKKILCTSIFWTGESRNQAEVENSNEQRQAEAKNVKRNHGICFIILWIYRIAQKKTNPQISECNDLHLYIARSHNTIARLWQAGRQAGLAARKHMCIAHWHTCTYSHTNTTKQTHTTCNACIFKLKNLWQITNCIWSCNLQERRMFTFPHSLFPLRCVSVRKVAFYR